MTTTRLPALVQRFFTQRLLEQQGVSPHTVASYRDTFRLLLAFAAKMTRCPPSRLQLEILDTRLVERFLRHLEDERGNSVRTRNARLSAIHAFFQFVAIHKPALELQCQRVLAIPTKRHDHGPVEFVSEEEATALISASNAATWNGARDRALLLMAYQTGLRNSELRALRREDLIVGIGAHVRCFGKGRKMRCTPIRPDVLTVLKDWLKRHPG